MQFIFILFCFRITISVLPQLGQLLRYESCGEQSKEHVFNSSLASWGGASPLPSCKVYKNTTMSSVVCVILFLHDVDVVMIQIPYPKDITRNEVEKYGKSTTIGKYNKKLIGLVTAVSCACHEYLRYPLLLGGQQYTHCQTHHLEI